TANVQFWESPVWKTPYGENLSDAHKLAGLSRFWSEVRYNFAWFEHLPDLDWDKIYLEYIPKALKTASTFEYYQVLRQMCALLRDSHTNVNFPTELQEQERSWRREGGTTGHLAADTPWAIIST